MSAEAVIAGAEIAAGHDGAAELVLRLRYPNGAEGVVVLEAEKGLELMAACGAAHLDELAGHSWRKLLEGACST
jgi:hypothetical protein